MSHHCHDCQKELTKGDGCFAYEVSKEQFLKCEECHKKDAVLRNFQKTEVYSRVVGYIRPVDQWNKGKQEEFNDRKEYIVTDQSAAVCC